jgi:polar amino acid transport system permease protein
MGERYDVARVRPLMTVPKGHNGLNGRTDLPVLLPAAERLQRRAYSDRLIGMPQLRLRGRDIIWIVVLLVCVTGYAEAQAVVAGRESVLIALFKWVPLLLKGFVFNITISVLSMALGTILGVMLGLMQISLLPPIRFSSWFVTQFFRNAPWLVLLFYCIYLLPFEIRAFGLRIPFPDWIKAIVGLSLPVMANVSEIVRGAVNSIPSGQWEAADSLAFNRRQTLWKIVLPQCLKRMLPPWMNLYAILTMATVLASIVGVSEVMTLARQVLAAEIRNDLLIPLYGMILLWFFLYCYPIARLTQWLERRYATIL